MKKPNRLALTASMLSVLLCVSGCDYEKTQTITKSHPVCDSSTIEARASFTLSCIANANPKSDEEPEDWITICQDMAIKTYCPEKVVTAQQTRDCSNCSWKDLTVTPVNGS